ncbi:hypothetical protein C497_05647 [Halalkalicoccus jeotgali B3]|uniref:Uncharacterized protein n=1 Tax=Halalkalicoccus jeotgali (strain DSM 18796 / CECT 7217 / JCM 14584 / KCTC 4019 / B3) TaxID=795797 RepID=D8JAW0_HALJB|nr:hypothetical protein HacjB3_07235 [Halalkalicoccus jeotgali B3]ELY39415.1 hypothetical protein C497_05647 [Halalkalicoccus jeotgali B3]
MSQTKKDLTTVAVSKQTHRWINGLRRGGETFDRLIQKMAAQYDPEEAN